MSRKTQPLVFRLVVASLAFVLSACAGTGLRESCTVGGFLDYSDFDAASLRYIIAVEGGAPPDQPFFAFAGSDRSGSPMSLALRFGPSDERLSRESCPAGSELRTYNVTNSSAAWRLFWLTADDVEGSFGFMQRDPDSPPRKAPQPLGLLLFDTATGDAQFACGCLR